MSKSVSGCNSLHFLLLGIYGNSAYKLPKFHIDIKNAGFEHVSPFKHGNFVYLYVKFWGGNES